ncbi:MAG: class I SAM-dependent methyltransferase [Dehalococcoidia bacterium]|nr:class I SAM-dependent methyltransferase [Dehalococcoidia bacterium]
MTDSPLKRAVMAGWDEMSDRYQRHAVISTDDVHYGPLIPGEKDFRLLGDVRGKRVLELACGGAQNSIALTKWGANVTAVDLSPNQIAHARRLAMSEGVDVALVQADIERLTMFPEASFDIIISSNGIEFVTDIEGCLREWHRVLRPGSIAVISTVHPLAAFEWDKGQGSLLVGNYFNLPVEVWHDVGETDGQRGLTFFRTIEEMFSSLTGAGFSVERILEPPPHPIHRMSDAEKTKIPYRGAIWESDYERMSKVPFNIIYVARKPR